MAKILLKGNPFETVGEFPVVGTPAPAFSLTKTDLADISSAELEGKRVVLNIFPSIDTDVCAASVRRFQEHRDG